MSLYNLGVLNRARGNVEAAIFCFSKAFNTSNFYPIRFLCRIERGITYLRIKEISKAEEDIKYVINL